MFHHLVCTEHAYGCHTAVIWLGQGLMSHVIVIMHSNSELPMLVVSSNKVSYYEHVMRKASHYNKICKICNLVFHIATTFIYQDDFKKVYSLENVKIDLSSCTAPSTKVWSSVMIVIITRKQNGISHGISLFSTKTLANDDKLHRLCELVLLLHSYKYTVSVHWHRVPVIN